MKKKNWKMTQAERVRVSVCQGRVCLWVWLSITVASCSCRQHILGLLRMVGQEV